jgi:FecR protein
MTSRKLIPFVLASLLLALCSITPQAVADTSHARIIRLSLVQGDVRFARETHGDPLADSNATWESASPNLPIRQGYVLSTDNGRAAVEFENGTMAFLKEHTVLEFYDLSVHDDSRTTRLVLRQGTASFSVNPAGSEYFSVTGGDFTVEADSRSTFRIDNFDDGSSVENLKGHVSVLRDKNSTRLDKGHSFTVRAGDNSAPALANLAPEDDFDRWVAGRVDSVSTATTAALQYTGSPYYAPGFADLYTYGAFSNCGSYGYGWRPFGAGLGWSPFTNGQWFMDPSFGWTWMSYQPWGWAPFHYGGWLFDSSCGGWFYSPPGLYGYGSYPGGVGGRRPPKGVNPPRPIYHPVTAVFVRQGGTTGIVPMHPLDAKGKTPMNLEHGVLSNVGTRGAGSQLISVGPGQKWETLKTSPREAPSGSLAAAAPPTRVFRTVQEGKTGVRSVSASKDSSIAYNPGEHRFVNSNSSAALANSKNVHIENGHIAATGSTPVGSTAQRTTVAPPTTRSANSTPPSRSSTPPPARYSGGSSGRSGSSWSGSAGSSGGSGRSSSPPPSSSSAGSSSHPASTSSGGKPH